MRQQGSAQFRPHSAKPGHKMYRGQSSAQEMGDQSVFQKHGNRKQIRVTRPNITSNDFARILPRKIQQDKQRLYSQALQLKQNLNEYVEENIRLKTKISVLQRQKDKMSRIIDNSSEQNGPKGSRINNYQNRPYQKDNMIVRNLKKMVKDARQENELVKTQNQKIKKMMKYTKINQFQIEKKIIVDQNKRLSAMLQQYASHFTDQQEIERQNEQLKKYLQEELQQKQQFQEQREKYEQLIQNLQEKLQAETQKYQSKEKRLLKDFNAQKKRVQQLLKRNQDLVREIKYVKQNHQIYADQKQSKNIKNNRNNTTNDKSFKINSQASQPSLQWQSKYNDMKFKNEKLQSQLKEMKQQMKKAQSQIATLQQKQKINNSRFHINVGQLQKNDYSSHFNDTQKQQPNKMEQSSNEYNEDYDQQFQNQTKIKESKLEDSQNVQLYKKDFQEQDQQVQELYKIDKKPKKNQNNSKQTQQSKKKSQTKNQSYKPNKKLLAQIKELLTYRMRAQRYPFSDIKSDIQSAQTTTFTYIDLCNMFVNQPFYLTSQYTKTFLTYCYEKQKIEPSDSISNSSLLSKLRKVVDDFELLEEEQQKEMIIKIAEMTSAYPTEFQLAFQNIKNGEQTVGRADLIEMFKKLELEDKYIDLIISELSLCSDDLEHLNFHGFFQRFYIQDDEEYIENNAIQEQGQESEQSHKYSSRLKKQPLKESIKQQQEQEINEDNNHS